MKLIDVAAALILSVAGSRNQRLIVKKLLRFGCPGLAALTVFRRRPRWSRIRARADECIQKVLHIVTYVTRITHYDENQKSIIVFNISLLEIVNSNPDNQI